jgi:hypothetical protein
MGQPKVPPPPRHLQSQMIGKEPNLPNLPKYSGKYLRFRGGIYGTGLTAGKGYSYHLRYETAESPSDVLNWYENALKSYGYKIAEMKPTKLMAFNPERGTTVLLIVMGPNQPGYSAMYRSHFTIRYIEQEPRKEEKQDNAERK